MLTDIEIMGIRNSVEERFVRASGPGGQKVNKTSSAVQVRLWVSDLPIRIRERVVSFADKSGSILVIARDNRSQRRNRDVAFERLIDIIRIALVVPVERKTTEVKQSVRASRIEEKRRRGEIKKCRRNVDW